MRLFHQLHLELKALNGYSRIHLLGVCRALFGRWRICHSTRFLFVIYPGQAEGILGKDILVVDALEPGHYASYQQAKAIISRTVADCLMELLC